MTICKLCGKEYNDYQGKMRARCGACNTKIRRYRTKAAAIRILGGKCVDCGWRGHQAALQFHHLDPQKKDFTLGNVANKSWESIRAEILKCTLLCANCHAVRHSTKDDERFLAEAAHYRGKRLKN
ncbi:MAG: HNH endonuclease [Candidatus Yanofskybacteria bacterium]|nr:HNH endonuclease [Candidatus Yanofskybacteria bacterium]